jgi:hypothetical protein
LRSLLIAVIPPFTRARGHPSEPWFANPRGPGHYGPGYVLDVAAWPPAAGMAARPANCTPADTRPAKAQRTGRAGKLAGTPPETSGPSLRPMDDPDDFHRIGLHAIDGGERQRRQGQLARLSTPPVATGYAGCDANQNTR